MKKTFFVAVFQCTTYLVYDWEIFPFFLRQERTYHGFHIIPPKILPQRNKRFFFVSPEKKMKDRHIQRSSAVLWKKNYIPNAITFQSKPKRWENLGTLHIERKKRASYQRRRKKIENRQDIPTGTLFFHCLLKNNILWSKIVPPGFENVLLKKACIFHFI